jgi:hypothetical protein
MRWALAILMSLVFADAAAAAPAVSGCRDRIASAVTVAPDGTQRPYRFHVGPSDLRVGAIAFHDLKSARSQAAWTSYVARDQWIKSVALVRPGARVTLTVPADQRAWMRLKYGGRYEVTLVGCRRFKRAGARRRECGHVTATCRRGPTPFSGGFDIDFATAPQQGRCAELVVSTPGHEPRRVRLFAAPGECTAA